jgi:putative ABC transport system permease protein
MNSLRLVRRSVTHHWRTNLAVVLGVAAAVSVLSGALLVGESVRGSLRDIAIGRLGRVEHVVGSTGFFRDAL